MRVVFLLSCYLTATVVARSRRETDTCHQPCPQDCGQTQDANGCNVCTCDEDPFHGVPPTPSSGNRNKRSEMSDEDMRKCNTQCPADCGCTITNGEPECKCGQIFYNTPPPSPAVRSKREEESDSTICSQACPQDCGCTITNGEAKCECGQLYFNTPPPPPPAVRSKREEESDATKCRRACPQDCGCLINELGEAKCDCSVNPLVRPTPPIPPCPGGTPSCEDPCLLVREEHKICPVCQCPES